MELISGCLPILGILLASYFSSRAHLRRENSRAGRGRAMAPLCSSVIGRRQGGAELKLVGLHAVSTSVRCVVRTPHFREIMSSFFAKHLMFSSNTMQTAMGDLRRYEGFFPHMTGATYDPISLFKEDRGRSPETGFFPTSLPHDYGFRNASFSFSRYEIFHLKLPSYL